MWRTRIDIAASAFGIELPIRSAGIESEPASEFLPFLAGKPSQLAPALEICN
jgi:hypothetical protein